MDALKRLETRIQVMLESASQYTEKAVDYTVDQWNQGYQSGHISGVQIGKIYLEILLKALKSEQEKAAENQNPTPGAEPGQ